MNAVILITFLRQQADLPNGSARVPCGPAAINSSRWVRQGAAPMFVPVNGHFQVAPAYDMLPMRHAPVRGVELAPRAYEVALPQPASFDVARPAARAAQAFWERASEDARISESFRAICAANAQALQTLRRVMG